MNEGNVMYSARDAAAASDAVILSRLWATCTLREPPPGWLCPIGFKPGVGEAFEGPFAKSFEPFDETEKLLVQASQLDWSQVRQPTQMPQSLDSRQFASQQLECSSEEPVQQATTQETLVEASQLLLWFMYACVVQQAAQLPRSLARSTICFPAVRGFIGGACATGSSNERW